MKIMNISLLARAFLTALFLHTALHTELRASGPYGDPYKQHLPQLYPNQQREEDNERGRATPRSGWPVSPSLPVPIGERPVPAPRRPQSMYQPHQGSHPEPSAPPAYGCDSGVFCSSPDRKTPASAGYHSDDSHRPSNFPTAPEGLQYPPAQTLTAGWVWTQTPEKTWQPVQCLEQSHPCATRTQSFPGQQRSRSPLLSPDWTPPAAAGNIQQFPEHDPYLQVGEQQSKRGHRRERSRSEEDLRNLSLGGEPTTDTLTPHGMTTERAVQMIRTARAATVAAFQRYLALADAKVSSLESTLGALQAAQESPGIRRKSALEKVTRAFKSADKTAREEQQRRLEEFKQKVDPLERALLTVAAGHTRVADHLGRYAAQIEPEVLNQKPQPK